MAYFKTENNGLCADANELKWLHGLILPNFLL
jgi:hypothetical protein